MEGSGEFSGLLGVVCVSSTTPAGWKTWTLVSRQARHWIDWRAKRGSGESNRPRKPTWLRATNSEQGRPVSQTLAPRVCSCIQTVVQSCGVDRAVTHSSTIVSASGAHAERISVGALRMAQLARRGARAAPTPIFGRKTETRPLACGLAGCDTRSPSPAPSRSPPAPRHLHHQMK